MMSKFKQLRLRLVVAVAVLLMAGMGTEAFAQCYTKNLQQAESLYKQGRYAEAKKRFAAAKACPDKPKTNNLDSRIAACNRKIKERSSSSTQPSRRQSTPSTTSRTNSFKITSVSFRNEDIDDNVLNAYGERLCAADVHYLMPRIYYKSTYSSSQDWAFKYKIYKPDGTLMSGSTSPSGYTNSFFKYEGGDFLKDYNNDYGTTGGQVCCPDSFTPNYDSTRFSDFRLFMPYDELHMAKGKYDLAFHILIYDQDTQEDIVRSSDQNFTFTQN